MDSINVIYLFLLWLTCCVSAWNDRPVIGILTQDSSPEDLHYGDTFLELPYVSYIEMAGARVVPVRMKESLSYYTTLFGYLNGVLLPGGGASLETSEYARTSKIFYDLAMQANAAGDYFPVWGTCLGFEMLSVLTAGKNLLAHCGLWDVSVPVNPLPGSRQSRLLQGMPTDLYNVLVKLNVTANFHHQCLTMKNFTSNADLRSFYRPISVNQDSNGNIFISTFEGYKYPIYGTQWHPEKNPFLWDSRYHINHSMDAVRVAQYMANFFVQEEGVNKTVVSSQRLLEEEHIYIILSLGMVACLLVGMQLGRCIEAHSQSDSWPDVLHWALHNSRHRGDSRQSAAHRRNSRSGQRVKLLQHDKHYFTFEESTETEEL